MTARVARLVKAYDLMYENAHGPYHVRRQLTERRVDLLKAKIAAVLPQLTPDETDAYYAAVRKLWSRAS